MTSGFAAYDAMQRRFCAVEFKRGVKEVFFGVKKMLGSCVKEFVLVERH